MRFWDASAIVPLCTKERWTERLKALLREDGAVTVLWTTSVELASALARRWRDRKLSRDADERARARADMLATGWNTIGPTRELKEQAMRLLRVHPLRAGDALQLGAALVWAENRPAGREFLSLDPRLREAAQREGFRLLPEEL